MLLLLALLVGASLPAGAAAQDAGVPATLKVFLDCRPCDFDFLRTEVPYVEYVRDRVDADVHVLVTTQDTGSNGREYTFAYIGVGALEGRQSTATYTSSGTDTADERRRGYTRVFALGLVPYLLDTRVASALALEYTEPAEPPTAAPEDPWNAWIFRFSASTNLDGESRQTSRQFRGSASANRTTEKWILGFSVNGNYDRNLFTLSDGSTLSSLTQSYSAHALGVKSLGPDHWAGVVRVEGSQDSRTNHDVSARTAAGIEYSVFPYSESTTRSLVLQYTVGANYYDYTQPTIYGKLTEMAADERLFTQLSLRQPWGSTSISFETANYLSDFSRHHFQVDGRLEVRLFRGFTLNVDGNAEQVHDQLYLPAGGASDEEILLRRRQLETSYRYSLSVGFSFQFGSIFNNVVNPRFGN